MRALTCFAEADDTPHQKQLQALASTMASSGCHASRLDSWVENSVPIDSITSIPEDLYNRLIRTADRVRHRGQHSQLKSRTKGIRRLVLTQRAPPNPVRSKGASEIEPFVFESSLGSLDTTMPSFSWQGTAGATFLQASADASEDNEQGGLNGLTQASSFCMMQSALSPQNKEAILGGYSHLSSHDASEVVKPEPPASGEKRRSRLATCLGLSGVSWSRARTRQQRHCLASSP